jgi:hypothetical protein
MEEKKTMDKQHNLAVKIEKNKTSQMKAKTGFLREQSSDTSF